MSADDTKAKERILAVLGDTAVGKISFTAGAISVSPSLYAKVADAIRNGQITVMVQPTLIPTPNVFGRYYNRFPLPDGAEWYDVLAWRTPDLLGPRQALVVHECTHAGFDILKAKMTSLENEAAAYVAEAMFVIAKAAKSSPTAPYPGRPGASPIHEAGWAMAAHFFVGTGDRGPLWWIQYTTKLHALLAAILKDPEYGPMGGAQMKFDGVGREWKAPTKSPLKK